MQHRLGPRVSKIVALPFQSALKIVRKLHCESVGNRSRIGDRSRNEKLRAREIMTVEAILRFQLGSVGNLITGTDGKFMQLLIQARVGRRGIDIVDVLVAKPKIPGIAGREVEKQKSA